MLSASALAALPDRDRSRFLESLTPRELAALEYDWHLWARPNQIEPAGEWLLWFLLAGRGFGKTRCGAEWVRAEAEADTTARIALVGATAGDVRDTMIEGESGILAVSPPWFRPKYEPSKRRLTWPNGAIATTFSADEPDRLRGPQHSRAWCDELAAWRYPAEAWANLQMGLRLGQRPRAVVTSTPRPVPIVRELVAEATTHVTRGSTLDNRANLAASFVSKIVAKYGGTRLGRQELEAEILEDNPNALFSLANLDRHRVSPARVPALRRVVVAVDPAVTSRKDSDETGIVVVGEGADGHAYVLDDLSGQYPPDQWARRVVAAYRDHKANRVVAEVNNGGDLVEVNIRTVDPRIAYAKVHASRGKFARAEPVSTLYEQGRVHHVGTLAKLEDQMATWDPIGSDKSPDRLDALVWGVTWLLLPDELPPPRGTVRHSMGLGV